MKRSLKRLCAVLAMVMGILSLAGCGQEGNSSSTASGEEQKTHITIGCMPLNQEGVQALSDLLKDKGYDLEVVVCDGNNLPAEALSADEIDGLILNHLPWIQTFNEANGTNLVLVDGFAYASLNGLYSSKHQSVDEIPDGGTITISNDPSNMDRGLRFLQNLGLLTLGEKTGDYYTILDIAENPKNLQFLEVETTMTAGSYEDADATITFSSVMKNAGYDAFSYLAEDGESGQFPTGLVVNSGDENSDWAKAIIEVAQSDEYHTKFDEIFQGAYVILDQEA